MCVVTLLPLPGGFALTSNRDEHTSRPAALPPQAYTVNQHTLVFPKDPQGGGTWFASSATTTVCLLNGAFENHQHYPPYKNSRGLVVLDFFDYITPQRFADAYDFGGIEPFTMVIVSHALQALTMHELRWNGQQVYLRNMPTNAPHIWSSVTLYTLSATELRKTYLAQFLSKHPHYTADDLFAFHRTAGDGDPNHDFVMNRPRQGVRTVSVTQVCRTGHERTIRYHELATGAETHVAV